MHSGAGPQRTHPRVNGVIPVPLWIVLFFVSAVIFFFMLFFADSGEGPFTQAMLMGSVTSVITILLLLLVFFNQPFQDDVGWAATGLDGAIPTHHRRRRSRHEHITVDPPCDEAGLPF